jgi:WD40 repeat protein
VSYETSDEPLHACATHPTSSRDVVVVASWDGVATIHEATTTTTTRVGRSRVLSENTTTGTPTRRTPHHLHHRDYAPIATLVGHDAGLYAVAFRASDEKLVGTASGDGGVRLFDWSDVSDSVAPCVRHIRAHDGAEVNDVAFQDGGGARWLVTASDDGTARVYDVATGARVGVAEGHAAEARSSITLVPIRPRSRGERRSLRTFSPADSLRPGSLAFNPDTPRAMPFNSASDAFQLHPDVRSYGRLPSGVRRAVRAGRERRRARRRHRDRVVRRHRQTVGRARAGDGDYRG